MNRDAALDLCARISAWCSPDKPFSRTVTDAWIELLTPLDEGRAGTAFVRLRHSDEPPTPRAFERTYRTINSTPTNRDPFHPGCAHCDDTGWITTANHTRNGTTYSGVKPCAHCDEGRARAQSQTWTQSPPRHFISDTEAERLAGAERARHNPPKGNTA